MVQAGCGAVGSGVSVGRKQRRGAGPGRWWRYPRCAVSPQVSELPFPFERHQQFEQSIRTPVGSTWNTQRAFQKLTSPRVITRAGHIIQPLSAEDVTSAGSGAKPVLEIAPKQREQSSGRPHKRAR